MSRLSTVSVADLSADAMTALEPFKIKGEVSPVYRQIANSESTLTAYLGMETALKSSQLHGSEIEAIKLLVSELSQCDYCLSVHQMKATAVGLDKQQIASIRDGEPIGVARIDAILKTVLSFFKKPGPLTDTDVAALRAVGFSDAELVDIALAISTIFFTNNFNHINNTRL